MRRSVSAMAVLRCASILVALSGWAAATAAATPAASPARLDFEVREGRNLNHFVREGSVAAHLLLRSGTDPRVLVAFPAGNSGVGLWFAHQSHEIAWTLGSAPHPVQELDSTGRPLRGIAMDITATGADLQIRQAVLSSVRVLRDFESLGTVASELTVSPSIQGQGLRWSRDRLDGAAGYRLTLEVTKGKLADAHIYAAPDGTMALRVTALTGETPLTPLFGRELLSDAAAPDAAARDTLRFLAYREKFLAGSWRFDTYFGRDTLMSVRLLMPALSASAIESGLASVLARLSPQGEVAHEEDIGERAVLDHLALDGRRSAEPVYDYKMIDSSYLLAPVTCAWLLHDPRAKPRAAAFLAATTGGDGAHGGTRGAALVGNLRFVLQTAMGFAAQPDAAHLIALKAGYNVGDWRDSETGLGGGRYPYDVNAVLVPAAVDAAAQLYDSGLLAAYLADSDRELFARAAQMAQTWRSKAPALFEVSIPPEAARVAIAAYATQQDVLPQAALATLTSDAVRFHALALDASGAPIPVMHSDEGFALLFETLDLERLDRAITALSRPFPAGLMTGAGMVVANPVFCTSALQAQFSRNAYHGTVVWSWQQALFAAGLARQLQRHDLPPTIRARLRAAQNRLWAAIHATQSMKNSELWSWSSAAGQYHVEPFGSAAADVDESNAAQLWSTVYLAVRPPSHKGAGGHEQ